MFEPHLKEEEYDDIEKSPLFYLNTYHSNNIQTKDAQTSTEDLIRHPITTKCRPITTKCKYKTTKELNDNETMPFNKNRIIRYYESPSGLYYILFPNVSSRTIVHTYDKKSDKYKNHYKYNFMTLTTKRKFNKLIKGVYVGCSDSFMENYFSEKDNVMLNDLPEHLKIIINNFEL